MTKLKKKKSKKRTKKQVSVLDLTAGEQFESLIREIESNFRDALTVEDYRFALSEELIAETSVLSAIGKKGAVVGLTDKTSKEWTGLFADLYSIPDLSNALDCLSLLFLVSQHGEILPSSAAIGLLQEICKGQVAEDNWMQEDPVTHQILFGELPVTVGLLFPSLEESNELIDMGRRVLASGMEELLDGDGLPHGNYVAHSGMLLAIWTRTLKLCDLANTECYDIDAQTQFEFLVRQMLRLIRKDGTLVFSKDDVDTKKLLQSSMSCYHDDDDSALASLILSKAKNGKGKKASLNSLPEASTNSEWGELAVMQTEWLPKCPKLTVRYGNRKIIAELSTGGVIFNGEIQSQFVLDDKLVAAKTDWEVVCWHSDQDGDFLELECELENGAKWQKHFLLARNELFLLTGDVLMDSGANQIRFESSWPMASDVGFGATKETNEMYLIRKAKTVAGLIPVSLPEWKIEKTDSQVSLSGSKLDFVMVGAGSNIYCPLFFDLDPKRCRKALTWRQLTVAEKLEILPKSEAVGFRVHVGDQQWLIYRSLAGPESRTVFGQNLSVEFYVGTFESDGTCSEIISVD